MNNDPEVTKNYWEDGNGGGSEKMDAWDHLAWHSKDLPEFYHRAKQPFIKSFNQPDAEPKGSW
jgi:hypothetical protein